MKSTEVEVEERKRLDAQAEEKALKRGKVVEAPLCRPAGGSDGEVQELKEGKQVGPNVNVETTTTVRHLGIREDTAKYLRNLDENNALYDPKGSGGTPGLGDVDAHEKGQVVAAPTQSHFASEEDLVLEKWGGKPASQAPVGAKPEGGHIHNPEEWMERFNRFGNGTANPAMSGIRGCRLEVLQQTLQACETGMYRTSDGTLVRFEAPAPRTLLRTAGDSEHDRLTMPGTPAIRVLNGDCLTEAVKLVESGFKVAVLNMANSNTPGGGWKAACGAQEENLHRRSNIYRFLSDPDGSAWRHAPAPRCYPIPPTGALYSPDVCVFRGSEPDGYPFLTRPVLVDIVSCAARAHPQTVVGAQGEPRLAPQEEETLRANVRNMLQTCREHGATALVLSALGCGAFKNPPTHVAEVFRDEITALGGAFREIVFAIYDDHNSRKRHNPEGNLVPFQRVFSDHIHAAKATQVEGE